MGGEGDTLWIAHTMSCAVDLGFAEIKRLKLT